MTRCEKHSFSWAKDDEMGCPICFGMRITKRMLITAVLAFALLFGSIVTMFNVILGAN